MTRTMQVPHRCPVCNGKGVVGAGFYSTGQCVGVTSTADETCQSCGGDGILWSTESAE